MTLIKGNQLSADQKRQVLAAYVNRHLDTTSRSDSEWLEKHAFYFTRSGQLSMKHKHCEPAFTAEMS
jgi:hypothetical protein